jgi:hypothetical protein
MVDGERVGETDSDGTGVIEGVWLGSVANATGAVEGRKERSWNEEGCDVGTDCVDGDDECNGLWVSNGRCEGRSEGYRGKEIAADG